MSFQHRGRRHTSLCYLSHHCNENITPLNWDCTVQGISRRAKGAESRWSGCCLVSAVCPPRSSVLHRAAQKGPSPAVFSWNSSESSLVDLNVRTGAYIWILMKERLTNFKLLKDFYSQGVGGAFWKMYNEIQYVIHKKLEECGFWSLPIFCLYSALEVGNGKMPSLEHFSFFLLYVPHAGVC